MALFQPSLSPGITVREIDLTGIAPNVSTSLSAFAGDFQWGPVEEIIRVQDMSVMTSIFGTPEISNAVDFISAEYFLKYSQNLNVVRMVDSDAGNAHSGDSAAAVLVKNEANYEAQVGNFGDSSGEVDCGQWIAKYPGEIGSTLSVSIFAVDSAAAVAATADSAASIIEAKYATWDYNKYFDTPPGTSEWAASRDGEFDEVHIAVIDRLGKISGTPGSVLETFAYVSVAQGAKTVDGGNNYITEVLKQGSKYIWMGYFDAARSVTGPNWGAIPNTGTPKNFATDVIWTNSASTDNLGYGSNATLIDTQEYINAFDLFSDPESVEIDIFIIPGMSSKEAQVTVVNHVTGICEARKDCIAVTSPNRAAVVGNITPVSDTLLTTNAFDASNYLVVDNNYLKVYDKYNGQYITIPAASSTAGLMAATDYNYGPWYSPAGEKRGRYNGVTALAYTPNKSERDALYKVGVNPIVSFPGRGVVLWGDKTKQSRPSAFDRINVRRLFLAVEKTISQAARNVLFEFNDEFTRADFVGVIEPVLREIQGRRGIQDYYVQCDETNNTPDVIDRNELVASIFIKPTRSINFITLNFVAVRSGVSFDEVVGRV